LNKFDGVFFLVLQNLRYDDAEQQFADLFDTIASFSSTVENLASLTTSGMEALIVEQTQKVHSDSTIGQEATGKEQEMELCISVTSSGSSDAALSESATEQDARAQNVLDNESTFCGPQHQSTA
jgi:hypothetical protein